MDKLLYRVAELSELTGIPQSSIYAEIAKGRIEVVRLGKAIHIPRRAIEALIGEPPVSRQSAAVGSSAS